VFLSVQDLNDKVIVIAELEDGNEISLSLDKDKAKFLAKELLLWISKEV
jgi:hypothetical protein